MRTPITVTASELRTIAAEEITDAQATMPARSEIEAARASGRADFVRECGAYCAAQGKPHLGIWLMEYEIRARANACLGPAPAPILPAPTSSEVFLARTLFAWDAWRVSTDATTAAAGTLDEALCHVEIDGQPVLGDGKLSPAGAALVARVSAAGRL